MKKEVKNPFGYKKGVKIVIPLKGYVKEGRAIVYGPGWNIKHLAYSLGKKIRNNGRNVLAINERFIFLPTENLEEAIEQLKMFCWNMTEQILIPKTEELKGIEEMDLSDQYTLCL